MADRNENQAPEKLQVKFYKTQNSDPLTFHCFSMNLELRLYSIDKEKKRTKYSCYVLKTGEVSSNGCLLYSWNRSSCFLEQYSHHCRLLLPSFPGSVSVRIGYLMFCFGFVGKIVETFCAVCRIIILQGYYHLCTNHSRLEQS